MMRGNLAAKQQERVDELVDRLEKLGVDSLLDDVVHDVFSTVAADTNNGGYESQVLALVENMSFDEAVKEVEQLLAGEEDA